MEKTYLVSGAGSGIGLAIARALASEGSSHRVILLGRNRAKLEAVAATLPGGAERHPIAVADVTDAATLRGALQAVGVSSIEAVIANAGVSGPNRYGDGDRWNEVIETNLGGAYRLVNEALPALRNGKSPYRHIVIVSSILARVGVPGMTAYCASKAGLLGLMRSWALELAPEKILVNTVCPGWVETEMAEQGIRGIASDTGKDYEGALKLALGDVPLRKMSQPEEIAALVRYLVSPAQCSITGGAFDVNNGQFMAP